MKRVIDNREDIVVLGGLFRDKYGENPEIIERMPGAGSSRIYYRLRTNDNSCIGTVCDDPEESRPFVALSKLLNSCNINVPKVYSHSADFKFYLQQDLGDESLFDLLKSRDDDGNLSKSAVEMVMKSIRQLVKAQSIDINEIKSAVNYPEFNRRQVMWDLNYFKYEFLKTSGVVFDENSLEDDFDRFADCLLKYAETDCGFMYRDFQSRNVQVYDNEPWLIDFQSGRVGPRIYDIVSFLWQAKANFSDSFRREMSKLYFRLMSDGLSHTATPYCYTESEFSRALDVFALFRTLQVLGAYGLRGLVERKAHFIESIPHALRNLEMLLERGVADDYPTMKGVCEKICNDPRFTADEHDGLMITVFSFSYKKGYPADFTGNGGGFMFDCRGMHNPGRYDEYKPLTGRDKPVVDFLEERGEVQGFTGKAIDLVSPTVERYIQRGFSNLQIGFGCTGGRHRSVYCAERVAHALAQKYPQATVKLIHREQGIEENL